MEDYKEKYEMALERASECMKDGGISQNTIDYLNNIFPELKESEDERIRKELIRFHKTTTYVNGVKGRDVIAWLEKQGDLTIRFFTDEFEWALGRIITFWNQNHKDGKYNENELMSYIKVRKTELVKLFTDNVCKVSLSNCSEEYRKAYYDGYNKCNRDYLKIKDISVDEYNKNAEILLGGQGEQKPVISDDALREGIAHFGITQYQIDNWLKKYVDVEKQGENPIDKVEPKFNVGDWICNGGGNPYKVNYIFGNCYELRSIEDYKYDKPINDIDANYHLWTLNDAKDGDVLISRHNKPFIYNGNHNHLHVSFYCGISAEDRVNVSGIRCGCWTENINIHPATKEQRDLLFKKMHEEGYEWDEEKKELYKRKEE